MRIENKREMIIILVLIVSLGFLFFESYDFITGKVTEGTVLSNVTVYNALAISFSTNLSDGILFGTVAFLPVTDINGSHNYDGTNNSTSYYISVSSDSNSDVDFCIKANADLTSAGTDVIGLANETYSNSTSTNLTLPSVAEQIPLTTSYIKSGENILIGSNIYWRFFLDVGGGQATGNYNNSVSFKGIVTGNSC